MSHRDRAGRPGSHPRGCLGRGAGIGLEEQATADLTEVLRSDLPAVVDADALTLLAQHPQLQELVRHRRARTLLTPHLGEFQRLRGHPVGNPIADARELAAALHCEVLLKGRRTVIVSGGRTTVVDTGSSWAATPGSGDVLAGVLGAWSGPGRRYGAPGDYPLAR